MSAAASSSGAAPPHALKQNAPNQDAATETEPGSALSEAERLEAAADQAIAACGGDLRSAIRALILANEYLEYELCEMFAAVSKGYARGRVKGRGG